jgi:CubicO group peptidase (beta-lactamase class C family)/beta-glucosidase-like glycosyl hydrolase
MLKKVFLYFLMTLSVEGLAQPDKNAWVDSVFNSMSMDEKIGQLFLVPIPLHITEAIINKIESQIKSKEIGGVIFDSLGPVRQANITNRFQRVSKLPLLIAQDAPVGLGQRRDSTIRFPDPFIIGASKNDSMAYMLGKEMARKMKLLGAHINISSFANIATYQDSLSQYTFGQNEKRVASKAVAFMRGLQNHGALAIVKDFSLNGATVVEVNDGIPSVETSVDTAKTYTFFKLFENRVSGVMTSPARFPIFYQDKDLVKKNEIDAGAISLLFSAEWLKKERNYQGLTIVDLPRYMPSDEKSRGDHELLAFQKGNNLIISSQDVGPSIRKIKRLIKKDESYEAILTNSVRQILAAKYDVGLWHTPTVIMDNLLKKLNSQESQLASQKLYESAVTVVQDKQNVIPISTLENKHFLYIHSKADHSSDFSDYLSKYVNFHFFAWDSTSNVESFSDSLKEQHVIIIGIFPQTPLSTIQKIAAFVQRSGVAHEIILCDFGNKNFWQLHMSNASIITAYDAVPETLRAIPQVIFGGLKADGVLPFTFGATAVEGTGRETESLNRLAYSLPEDAGMNSATLENIKTIVDEAIATHATPGCQILIARNGKVIYDKTFGGLTYENADSVKEEHIYDLASVTKVSATLQAVMFLYEKGLIDLNKKLSYYLQELKNTNKKDITLIEMLTHQAGLLPFIPMWTETVKNNVFLPQYYSRIQNEVYPLQVSPDLYASPLLRDSVWSWIGESRLQNKPPRTPYAYQYSDLGFLLLQRLAERIFNQPIDEFLSQNLYEPLGAYTTGYTPLNRFPAQRIAPTEDDKIYRKTHIAGTVHDERAAMMGGVAGHAGLFSNATDLAKLCQMLLQEGSYGGYQYYKKETVNLFTAKQFDKSRRGLGWDKPVQSEWNSPTSLKASPKTFGHTGFTGTCIWMDPEFNLVYIFLSNRVFPDRSAKLITSNIRSRIQDVIYQSIFDYCQYNY